MAVDTKDLWDKLEKDGETVVRQRLANNTYASDIQPLVQAWLAMKQSRRTQQEQAEAMGIARSAQRAAWVAAFAAIISAIAALVTWLSTFKP